MATYKVIRHEILDDGLSKKEAKLLAQSEEAISDLNSVWHSIERDEA